MSQQTEKTYFAQDTHCASCKILLERHIGEIAGVTHVRADYHTGVIRVRTHGKVSDNAIHDAIRTAGYEVGTARVRSWFSTDGQVWTELLIAGCLVFVLWLFFQVTGLATITQNVQAGSGATGALLAGLVAGVSTCMALVGGLVLSIAARHAQRHPEASALQKFRPHLFFGVGRLVSFALLGGLLGSLGSWVKLSVSANGWLIIIVGLVMFLLGLSLTGAFPRMGSGLVLPPWIARRLGLHREAKEYSHAGAALVGALTFFLPCGFTQAAQVAAVASGSWFGGMAIMTAFALGTAPGLLGIGGLSSVMRGTGGRIFFRTIGVAVIALGFWNVSNGWNLTGLTLPTISETNRQAPHTTGTTAVVENGVQVIRMNQWAGGYNPNTFVVKKGIPVQWQVTSADQYGCSSTLLIPSLGIRKNLAPGLNTIEFTPQKTGPLKFSCSMGMYTGTFSVIN